MRRPVSAYAQIFGMRNYCLCSHQLASVEVKGRLSPPLLMIVSAMDQILTVPPRWHQLSTGVSGPQAKAVKDLGEGKL